MQTLEGALPKIPLQHPVLLLAGKARHMITIVFVPNRIGAVPTKKMAVIEEPAPCQDTCDLALAFSLFGWHYPEGKFFCGPRQ